MIGNERIEEIEVKEKDLALHVGSGMLNVFSTPAMIAYMEGVSMRLIQPYLEVGQGTVGIAVNIKHMQASALGECIAVKARVEQVEGKKVILHVSATNIQGISVGTGTHERFIIDELRFMQKLS